MLIQEPKVHAPDPILAIISVATGRSARATEIRPGIYEIGHFGSSAFLRDYEEYDSFGERGNYGVCDTVEQLLQHYPELEAEGRHFVVTITRVRRDQQSEEGGWRWHKWGEYIGTQNPRHEYLFDDTHIDEVLVFHIYEKKAS